ncbi:Arc family DNA-binding protein [Comamonas sp. NoAH]|uniref:Arc family DNA-binding protein n=1 Tax=Comamonas halotolerans TaxID=3041496 RepID=UPI0032EA5025
MIKYPHSTVLGSKRRTQVGLELPVEIEEFLRQRAQSEFRSFSKEIAMRLIRSVEQEAQHGKLA